MKSQLQVFVDPPPPTPQDAAGLTLKKVKRRATAQGSIAARKSLPNPDAQALASPKISGIARPVSDVSPTASSIARPVRMGRASLPLIQVQGQLERREGVVSPPPRLPPVTRLPAIPTSPPIPLSPPVGTALDFLTFNSGRESVTAIASTLQIPTSPPPPREGHFRIPVPNVEKVIEKIEEEETESAGDGPTLTSDEVLVRIDAEIAFDTLALEKINERIAQIYELKVELRRAVRMSRTL